MQLWNNNTEIQFFTDALRSFATPEQLFYHLQKGYFAYIPRSEDANGQALNARNSLIGQFTEKWCQNLFEPVARELNLYAVNGVICEELGLSRQTSADLAFCTTNSITQKAENIKLLFEVKMSVISNYQYHQQNDIQYVGDYKQHKGNPSLLRSDSMLKAIGKSINIRVSGTQSSKIPIVVLGNSPITENYVHKVDFLKTSGVVQNFWSLNPNPTRSDYIRNTDKQGFQTIFSDEQLFDNCKSLINKEMNFFSSMTSKTDLGKIIKIASQESNEIACAEKFLTLIRN
jgi:hypothetical protein